MFFHELTMVKLITFNLHIKQLNVELPKNVRKSECSKQMKQNSHYIHQNINEMHQKRQMEKKVRQTPTRVS